MLRPEFKGNNIEISIKELDNARILADKVDSAGRISGFKFYSQELASQKSPAWLVFKLPILIENQRKKGHTITNLFLNTDLNILFFQEVEEAKIENVLAPNEGIVCRFSVLWGMQGDRYTEQELKQYSDDKSTRPKNFAHLFRVELYYIDGLYMPPSFQIYTLADCRNLDGDEILDDKLTMRLRCQNFRPNSTKYDLGKLEVLRNTIEVNYTRNLYNDKQNNKIRKETMDFVYGLYLYTNGLTC